MTEAEFYRTPPTARMALLLKKNGISRVRPLVGGVAAWRARNYPLEGLEAKVV